MPRARVTNAAIVGAQIDTLAQELDRETRRSVRELADESVDMFRLSAPVRSGNLAEGIKARIMGAEKTVDITVHARDEETGYDYAGVTRFGHRLEVIRPVVASALAIHFADGTFGLFGEVSGYDPPFDWVDRAFPSVEQLADRELERLGQRLELRVFT